MPKIIYVDEQPEQRNAMIRAVVLSGYFDEDDIVALEPWPNLADMIAEIDEFHPLALITDFRLAEYMEGISYDGVQLASRYLESRKDFPCFVTTGFAVDAANAASPSVDVNAIFSKKESFDTNPAEDAAKALPFFLRVKLKIDAHQKLITDTEHELWELREKLIHEGLSPVEAERLLDVDGELESMIGNEHKLPENLKQLALKPLTDIVEKAGELLSRLEAIYPDDAGAAGA